MAAYPADTAVEAAGTIPATATQRSAFRCGYATDHHRRHEEDRVSGINDGRVVVITGAGGGIGRAHALGFAAEGARVVVNDLGSATDGTGGGDVGPAQKVVEEIKAAGGEAVANGDDISSWDGAKALIDQAIDTFGTIDVLVNNAGILRDRMMVNMGEAEWDAVIKVHLKGTFAPSRHAADYWKSQSKAGNQPVARIINTSSPSGLFGNVGQANYGAAKAGIAAFTVITATELSRYGVTVNAIAPVALTRMTENLVQHSEDTDTGKLSPDHISPIVVWLGSPESGDITGRVFGVLGNKLIIQEPWVNGPEIDRDEIWSPGELSEVIPDMVRRARGNSNMRGYTID
jgi:NAD(P)-dependent dehydrogenase (short-subunit alcohol dehydrogenase family)